MWWPYSCSLRRLRPSLAVKDLGRAALERRRGAGDRVGEVEIGDWVGKRRPLRDLDRFELRRRPGKGDQPRAGELRMVGEQAAAQFRVAVERQRTAERIGEGAKDRPVGAGVAGGIDRLLAILD